MKPRALVLISASLTCCIYAASRLSHNPEPAIPTIGTEQCREQTADALLLLKQKAPGHYRNVLENIAVIECASMGSGMAAFEEPPVCKVGNATLNAGPVWYAGALAHDACHSMLYHDFERAYGREAPDEVWTGRDAEIFCLGLQKDALEKLGADESTIQHVNDMMEYAYWDIPYEERWW